MAEVTKPMDNGKATNPPFEGTPMIRGRHLLLLPALLVGACAPAPEPLTLVETVPLSPEEVSALELEVADVVNGLTEAMNAHDSEQVFSFYRQDESFFYLGCTDVLFGWGTFSSRVGPYYANNPDVTFQRDLLTIQILSPSTAVVALRGSSTEAEALFWTEVLKKGEDGGWLITYEHESWPDCSTPRGPHMGTEGMGEMELAPSVTPTSPGAH
jgi:ketosteroid isomerase-like protein